LVVERHAPSRLFLELQVKFNAATSRSMMALNCGTFSRLISGAHTAAEACAQRALQHTCGRYRVCRRRYSSVTPEENRLEQVCVSDSDTTPQVRYNTCLKIAYFKT